MKNKNLKITVKPNCGNSPNMKKLRDFNIAFAKQDFELIESMVTEDIEWNMLGDSTINGIEDFKKGIREMEEVGMKEITINNILTHGKVGAADGVLTDGNGDTYAFCDIYNFDKAGPNAKIKKMTSYVIKVDK